MDIGVESKEVIPGNYPDVQFSVNEELDVNKISGFLSKGTSRGGANFKNVMQSHQPELININNLPQEQQTEAIATYVAAEYAKHQEKMIRTVPELKTAWDEYAPSYFSEVAKIFPGISWPQGIYAGFLTISPPYPRFLEDKTFQVPYDSVPKGIKVTAHEMLHFIFYDLVRQKNLPDLQNTIQREMEERLIEKFKIPLWKLSEIFNIVVLAEDRWGIGQSKQHATSYTHLLPFVQEFEDTWEKSGQNAEKLLELLEIN